MKKYPAAMKKAREIAVESAGDSVPYKEVWLIHRHEQPPGDENALSVAFIHPQYREVWVSSRPVLITQAELDEYDKWSDGEGFCPNINRYTVQAIN